MRCRVGDLAIVIAAAPAYQDAIGREVTVIKRCSEGGGDWIVEFRHLPPSLLPYQGFDFSFYDDGLLPLRPGDDAEPETTDTPIDITAGCPA